MTTIYLIRHGETEWNREEIFRGRADISLNEIGFREAELIGEYLKGRDIHVVYSSPLSRARETARRVAQVFNLKVQPLEGIIDISFGRWEGRPLKEIQIHEEELYQQWIERPHLVRFPGGESLDEVRIRAMDSLEGVVQAHHGNNIVLVSHRVINRVIISGILGLDNSHFWQIGQDPAAINLIQFKEGKFVLSLLNETCHLKSLHEVRAKADF
jgi:broad specificity phosphatase PhoE